jgi:nitrate reductase gamma subunit
MESALEFAKGPLFVFTFVYMILGLLRQVFLQVAQMKDVLDRLSYKAFPVLKNLKLFIEWMLPVGHIYRNKPIMSICSFLFHIGLLIVPIFLASHIDLWARSIGISWPAIPMWLADALTILTLFCILVLFVFRLLNTTTRSLSSGSDYVLLICVAIPFATGFMAVHPAFNLFTYDAVILLHVLSSELIFILLPHSKLVHAVLFPFDRISSDIFWNMPIGAGDKIANELHGREAKV